MFNIASVAPFLKVFLGSLAVTMSLGCAHKGVEEDSSLEPIIANDTTLIIEGCGHAPIIGYTYCRKIDGQSTTDSLVFHVPPTNCGKSECIYVKILMPDGSPAVGLSAKSGETKLEVSWKTLLKREVFQAGDRGLWIVLVEIHYLDSLGVLKKTLIEAEIRLRVLATGYISLLNVEEDPNFIWLWQNNDRKFKMTSNGRSFMGGRNATRRGCVFCWADLLGRPPYKKEAR